MMKKLLLITAYVLLCICTKTVSAQDFSCATDVIEQSMITTNPDYAQERAQLEQFTQQYRNGLASRMINMGCQKTADLYEIPVVVHVMHLGESVGTGTNITDVSIQNAIAGTNTYLSYFGIKLVLAKRDPNGNSSNGITRTNCSNVPNYAQYGIDASLNPIGAPDSTIKKLSKWDNTQYANVWLVNKTVQNSAYASMLGPYQGIVIPTNSFSFQDVFHIFAHEMGHYFNLLHTFQGSTSTACAPNDDPYNQGDKCADTPPVKQSDCASSSCGTFSNVNNSLMNIMGYCNKPNSIFTPDQKTRVMASLFSEYRWSLVSSPGLIPTNVTTEIAIDSIAFVQNLSQPTCNGIVTPQIQIKNYGNTVNSLELLVSIDNIDTTIVVSSGFTRGSVNWVSLPSKTFLVSGSHSITVEVKKVNGVTDYNAFNNVQCMSFNVIVQTVTISTVMNTPAAGSFTGGGTFSCSGINDTIRVATNPGYVFQNIKEGSTIVSTNPTFVIPVDLSQGNRIFTAYHTVQTFAINVSVNGTGGTVSGGGSSIAYGASTTVIANSFSCWDFVGWYENNVLVSSSRSYTFSAYSARNLVAKFAIIRYQIATMVNNPAWGTISDGDSYDCGSTVTIRAHTKPGARFKNFSDQYGTIISTDSVLSFQSEMNRLIIGNFELIPVRAGSDKTICFGESVTISASNADSYLWNTGQSTASITVSPTATTAYVVTGFNGTKDTVVVTVKPLPNVNFTKTVSGLQVQFSAPAGNSSYSWDFGDGNTSSIQNPLHTYTSDGIKTVTFSSVLNGCSAEKTDTLTVHDVTTGIKNHTTEVELNLYPNPTSSFLTIEVVSNGAYQVSIIDLLGQTVWVSQEFTRKQIVDVSSFARGIYVIMFDDGKGSIASRQFVIN